MQNDRIDLPSFNKILYGGMLENVTVVHDKHRVRSRIGLHMIQGTLYKLIKYTCIESTLNNITVNDSFVKG